MTQKLGRVNTLCKEDGPFSQATGKRALLTLLLGCCVCDYSRVRD